MVPNLFKANVLISGQILEGFERRFEAFLLVMSARCEELRHTFCLISGLYFLGMWRGGGGGGGGGGHCSGQKYVLTFDDESQESAR